MSTQHTPGPWTVTSVNGRLGEEPGLYILAQGRELMRGDFYRSEADANLVAASPDMLAVLIDCANALGELLPSDHPRRAVLARANAVIDRARSQS